jgi:predicted dehydrogenase
MNLGAHSLDRTVWLGGGPATRIGATTLKRFGVDVETDALVSLHLSSGVAASVNVVSGLPELDRLTVVCDRGTLVADARTGAYASVDGTTTTLVTLGPDTLATAFRRQLADFAGAVDGAEPAVSTAHARHVIELVTTAYRAAASGDVLAVGGEGD